MQQAAGASAVEETKFRELREGAKREANYPQTQTLGHERQTLATKQRSQSGAKREANYRQTQTLGHERQTVATKQRSQSVRMRSLKTDIKGKKDFLADYDEKMAQLHKAASLEAHSDLGRRTAMASAQKEFEQSLKATTAKQSYKPGQPTSNTVAKKLKQLTFEE
eukprot:gene25436-11097_t